MSDVDLHVSLDQLEDPKSIEQQLHLITDAWLIDKKDWTPVGPVLRQWTWELKGTKRASKFENWISPLKCTFYFYEFEGIIVGTGIHLEHARKSAVKHLQYYCEKFVMRDELFRAYNGFLALHKLDGDQKWKIKGEEHYAVLNAREFEVNGDKLYNSGFYEEAIAMYEEAIRMYPIDHYMVIQCKGKIIKANILISC